jgi:hypothetical protein
VKGIYRAMPKYAMHGVLDIIAIQNGKFIGLEVKSERKSSQAQLAFCLLVQAAGGRYHVVRSIDDVRELGL